MSWDVILANSDDLSHIANISDECTAKSLALSLNRPGTFNFTIPLFTDYYDSLNPVEHCIVLTKNKNIVWSGPVWTRSESWASNKITMSAVGWFQLLNKRFITDADHTYGSIPSPVNEGSIAFSLLALANAQTVDAVARPTWITAGTNTSTGLRNRTYKRWQNIGPEIIALSDVESGFNFEIDPTTRAMNITNWDQYTDSGALFAFNFGPDNTIEITRQLNADDLQNQIYVANPAIGTAEAHETPSVDQYNLHQQVININEIPNLSILGAIANAEVAVNGYPRLTINFDPKAESPAVPSLFEDYDLGQVVHLTAKDKSGHFHINEQAIRMFGLTVNIDENGNERINSIQTTAQSS